jgi:hypothetical protein
MQENASILSRFWHEQFLNGPEPFPCGGLREPHLCRAFDPAVPAQFELREELSLPL